MYTKRFGMMPQTVNGLMEDFFFNGLNRRNDETVYSHVPVNIKETKESFDLQVIAPGLNKEDFKINVDKNNLTISFEQKKEETKEGGEQEKWVRTEYRMHSFKRNFTLTEKIDTAKIAAKYTDGILTVTLPKKEVEEPAKLEIAVN
jgi:HSP20 family protein